ncbi:MAG: metallophosphoesterase family protein [Candidatus Muiribacteriota bacterium]
MKIGIISDTHQNVMSADLRFFFKDLKSKVDFLIHCGDINGIDFLSELKEIFDSKLIAVLGNMDRESLETILNSVEIIEVEGLKIGVTHSTGAPAQTPENAYEILKKEKPDIILFGHSHHPYNEYREKILMLNPGSLLDETFAPYTSYGLIEIINGKIIKNEIIRKKID